MHRPPGKRLMGGASVSSLLDGLPGVEAEFARRVRRDGAGSFVIFALANRSRSARGVLARAASDGLLGVAELELLLGLAAADAVSDELATALVGQVNPKIALALAGLISNQRLTPRDLTEARTLYALVEQAHGRRAFGRIDRLTYLELLSDLGLHEHFTASLERLPLAHEEWRQVMLMAANLVNPWVTRAGGGQPGDVTAWRRLVHSIFNADGVEPIDVQTTVAAPFDNVLCTSMSSVPTGPKVTVLVPTHNPGRRIGTALGSLLNQTWRNLEILVLDDGSEDLHHHYLDAWADRDPRIRVLRMSGNTGNYAARNVGIERATGEFVTVHDDDDWSHPRKLEAQARELLQSPDTLATMSQLVRATDDLRFTRINANPSFIQPNYSSLMFRRRPVLDAIGYWNEVNRDADAEFRHRLVAWSGAAPTIVGTAPLSLLRVREGSLTSGEMQRGYVDPRRRWYQMSTEGWRRDSLASEAPLYLPRRQAEEAPFSTPVTMRGAGSKARVTADIVYATDFRFPGGNSSLSAHEIETLLDHGHRVALLQLDSPVLGSTKDLSPRIRRLALHPACTVVTVLDTVECDLLLVRHPTVLQFVQPLRSGVTSRRAVLIVNHPPMLRDGSAPHYDLAECVRNFETVFGDRPLVAPESGVLRECLRGLIDAAHLTPFDWNGIVPVTARAPRTAAPGRPPVIGRHSRDHVDKWPTSSADLEAAYPVDGSQDVRVLGGAAVPLARLPDRDVLGWTVHPFGSINPQEFLETVDFWVYFHSDHWIESFGMAVAEAMASGAVAVLPPYLESTFGRGAVYCKPDEVQHVVDGLWRDRRAYEAQSARGIEVATSRFTRDALLERIALLQRG